MSEQQWEDDGGWTPTLQTVTEDSMICMKPSHKQFKDSSEEWGVVQRIRDQKRLMRLNIRATEEAAREYMEWLKERDEETRQKAEEEKANDYPHGTNEWNYRWFHEVKDASYYIVRRTVTPWERIKQ